MNLAVPFQLNKLGDEDETLCGESTHDAGYCALNKRKSMAAPDTLRGVTSTRVVAIT